MADEGKRKRGRPPVVLTESARKRRRQQQAEAYSRSRIIIGNEIGRWKELKKDEGLKTDAQLASFLLDHYYASKEAIPPAQSSRMITSTPAQTSKSSTSQSILPPTILPVPGTSSEVIVQPVPFHLHLEKRDSPAVSEISAEGSVGETLSGVEAVLETESEGSRNGKQEKQPLTVTTEAGRRTKKKQLSGSFVDPFNLSVDISVVDEELKEDDPEYEPSFDITAVLPDEINEEADEIGYEELEFGMEKEIEEVDEAPDDSSEIIPGIDKISTRDDCERLSSSVICLAFVQQLKQLAQINIESCSMPECSGNIAITEEFVGSALYFKWVCGNGHAVYTWCAQPIMNRRLPSGDFISAANILFSGNNFGKIALWAQMMNLKFLSASKFHRIQTTYLVPTVDRFWGEHQVEVLESFRGKDLVVAGDGRNDSPGFSAQYVSYTLMEESSKKILTIQTLDKRVTGRKSAALEKAAFQLAMADVMNHQVMVKEVVTDQHLGIGALMRTDYPQIKHSYDIWHVAKNLGKKIIKVAKKKENAVLQQWSKDIVNHFWFACKTATTYNEFVSIWRSILHHITNQHEWILPHGDGQTTCLHGPLDETERNKQWLDTSKDVAALKALMNIVLDKQFLNRVGYFLNFRSTADLEVFHQHILMYCAKRFTYTPPVYRVRNKLAALDHNVHSDRDVMRNKQGNIVYHRCYNKKSARWSVFPHKVKKTYPHVRPLILKALTMRLEDKIGMKRKRELEPDDPRRISKTLAAERPPPTQTLVQEKQSRFEKI